MNTTTKDVLQIFSVLFGSLFVANVLFHLAIYAYDGTALKDVLWQVHAVTMLIGIAFLYLGRDPFLKIFAEFKNEFRRYSSSSEG